MEQRSAMFWALRCGIMQYIMMILTIIGFVIWDVNSNYGRVVGPVAEFVYRVAGGY